MKMMYSSLVIVAIVLSMAIAIPSDLTQTADAVKAKGVAGQAKDYTPA